MNERKRWGGGGGERAGEGENSNLCTIVHVIIGYLKL